MDPSHDDLPGGEQSIQQDQRRAFVGERSLGFRPPAKLPIDPLNGIRCSQTCPLAFREAVEA